MANGKFWIGGFFEIAVHRRRISCEFGPDSEDVHSCASEVWRLQQSKAVRISADGTEETQKPRNNDALKTEKAVSLWILLRNLRA